MKYFRNLTVASLIVMSMFAACKKNGTGGEATIVALPAHHGKRIKGCTVYVKFKTKELPTSPTSNYDLKVVGDPLEDHVHLEGLLPGNYYLFAIGIDSALVATNQTVQGGAAVIIKRSQSKKEIDAEIAVTEQ